MSSKSVSSQIVPAQITVCAEVWGRFIRAKSAAAAAEKEVKAVRAELGLPADAAAACALFGDAFPEAVICDGNGRPVGKLTVFMRDAYTVPAGKSLRIS